MNQTNFKYTAAITFWLLLSTTLFAETIRIMPLGDSITSGVTIDPDPVSERIGYRAPLYSQLIDAKYSVNFVGSLSTGVAVEPAFDVNNEGHPGWTSSQVGNNVYRYLSQNPADIVLLHIGTNDNDTSVAGVNDILDEIDLYEEQTGRFVRVIIALIVDRQNQSDVLISGFNHNLNNLVQKRIQTADALTLVDMYRGAGMTSSDYADNTHPSNAGYSKMADVWFNALNISYNTSLHSFPTTIVSRSSISSVSFDEGADKVIFTTDVPSSGITF